MLRARLPSPYAARAAATAFLLFSAQRFKGDGAIYFESALHCEVDWDTFPVKPINVAPTANKLLNYAKDYRAAFVLGSPGCGKSSLMQYIIEKKAFKKYGFDHVVEVKRNTDVNEVMDDLQKRRAKDKCLFLVDETQEAVAERWVDPSALYKERYFAMYFGTTALVAPGFTTPAELAPHRFWMYAPSLDRNAVEEYVESVLTLHGVAKGEAKKLAPWVFDYAGASMNALVFTLQAMLVKSPRNTFYSVRDAAKLSLPTPLYVTKFQGPRVVVHGEPNWAHVDSKVELAAELLAGGVATIDAKSSEALKWLLRTGFVQPVPDYGAEPAASLHHLSDTSKQVTWAHSWQPLYARSSLKIRAAPAAPVADPRAGVPQTTIDVVVRLVPLMQLCSGPSARRVARDSNLRRPSEADVRSTIERAALALGPECLEVKAPKKKKKRGALPRVDLMFILPRDHAPGRPRPRLALELTADATMAQLRKQTARFRPKTGKYAPLNLADWLVLDFRTTPQTRKEVTNRVKTLNVATMSPHVSYGWGVAVLDYGGKRVYLPLDGVPRFVPDWDAAAPEALPTQTAVGSLSVHVHVALPDGPLETDVAYVIRRNRLALNVDGLRDAVMASLPRKVAAGATVGDLAVYPPGAARGAAPIADPYTKLECTTTDAPYHVTVAGVSPPSVR